VTSAACGATPVESSAGPSSPTPIDAGLAYVRHGLRAVLLHEVLPDGNCSCRNHLATCPAPNGKDASGKHPRSKGWLKELITSEDALLRTFGRYPTANVGLCPKDDEIVLDIDPRNGGGETFAKLTYELGEPTGPCALTGGGGHHYWLKLPSGWDVATATPAINAALKRLGPGIDLRTCKNQVVVSPSTHRSGRRYAWVLGRSILECEPIVPSDAWLAALGLRQGSEQREHGQRSAPDGDDLARASWGLLHARLLNPDNGYHDWFRLGPALKALGDDGLRLWIEVSRLSKDFDEGEIRRKWSGIAGSSINALFGMFDDADPTWRERYRKEQGGAQAEPSSGATETEPKATRSAADRPWPTPMGEPAFRGLIGDFVRLVEDETEADRHALLVQFLVFFGNCIGRSPHLVIGATRHGTNLFAIVAGQSSRGRKGTSEAECRRLMKHVDEEWTASNICSGLSSGEGLIDVVRDPREGPPDKSGKPTVIPGVTDKRRMVSEGEFARVLAQVAREGNVLSSVLRQAWDGENLGTMVRGNPTRATEPHVSLVAHVTQHELLARMSETDLFNGLGNRFLWCCSRRTKKLPFGGNVGTTAIEQLGQRLRTALFQSRKTTRLDYTEAAREYWSTAYGEISVDRPGLWGALTARAEAQVLRLGMLYALLDSQRQIDVTHLESARAVWNYCDASVAYLFGDKLGNALADKIFAAIKAAGQAGITRTKLSAALGRNVQAAAMDAALGLLVVAGMVTKEIVGEGPKATEVWRAKA
jgi:hypothetical protein